ncbi:hypothetical protein EG329_009868 [Mollisiaceae sp. DMI_Dod_QoI]|nr:hypothetical protein EG329_009868 [Helotiales sp. DMI_Dod_QoI]
MPSVRTLLAGFVATALIHLSTATPIPSEDCYPTKPVKATPTIPSSGNTPDLSTTNLTLSYVAIGRGVQNYTCASPSATPVALGAIATLFDATTLAYESEALVHAIPPLAVYMPQPSSNLALAAGIFKPLGHHYFDAAGTPTFDLTAVGKILYGAKSGDVKAPGTANKGPAGTGAVDWLELSKKATYTSVGAQLAYRVVTAGGNAPAVCSKAGVITVQYAAEYWFYD